MIGNDIAKLESFSASFLARPERFMKKIYTDSERAFIKKSESPEKTALLFWTMKESAWKAYLPKAAKRVYNPKHFNCEIVKSSQNKWQYSGKVQVENFEYNTLSKSLSDYIYSVANQDEKFLYSSEFNLLSSLPKDQSLAVRQQLIINLSKIFKIDFNKIEIKNNQLNIPEAFAFGKRLPVQISITHYNLKGAYVFCIQ